MQKSKHSLKVFLCHAHADSEQVRKLYFRLNKDGIDAWFDKEKLLPGQDWELEIRKAVRETDIVLVCLSKQFNKAGFRQKEVRLALEEADKKPEGEIFIIPARLEECENLESLRKWHLVDLYDDEGYERLRRTFLTRAKEIDAYLPSDKNNLTQQFSKAISALTLKESLSILIDSISAIYKKPIDINCPENVILDLWTKHTLLEIATEAIRNATIHSGFYHNPNVKVVVNVDITNTGKRLELCVSDTGVGFDKVREGTGFARMKSFADFLNLNNPSTLFIESDPHKGTKVILKMDFSRSIITSEEYSKE